MKKIFLYMAVLATTIMGCNDLETEGLSRTTYYPEFVIEGETFYWIDEDDEFTDPGVTVLEQGSEIPFTTTVTGRFYGYSGTEIGEGEDEYTYTYTAVNQDGFSGSETRTVIKAKTGDFAVNNISGLYAGAVDRPSIGESYTDMRVLVTEIDPGVFNVSDALAGFYVEGRGLGDAYFTVGLEISPVDLPNGVFTYEETVFRLIDGAEMTVSDMVIDTDAHTISYHVSAPVFGATAEWDIVLTQLQPE